MKLFFISLLMFLSSTSNAAWRENEHRINSTLQVSHYNNIASQYLLTPTSIIAVKMGGIETLGVEPKNEKSIYFSIDYVDDYLAAISKYLEWQELAVKNGDSFKKQISEAKTKLAGIRLRFGFYSGNANNHYLTVKTCVNFLGSCTETDDSQLYDIENAKKLALLLTQLKSGELLSGDVSEKYK